MTTIEERIAAVRAQNAQATQEQNATPASEPDQSQHPEQAPLESIEHETESAPDTSTEDQEPDSQDDLTEQADDGGKKRKYVPKDRLDKELSEKNKAREEAQREREARIRLETELEMLRNAVSARYAEENPQQPQQPQEVLPDPLEDPVGYEAAVRQKVLKEVQSQLQPIAQTVQEQQFVSTLNSQQAAFQAKTPDFVDAYQHLQNITAATVGQAAALNAAQYGMTPEQAVNQATVMHLRNIANQVLASGGNVAEYFYNLAKTTGYKQKTSAPQPNLDAISRNQQRTTGLGSVSSVPVNAGPSVKTLVSNPQQFFEHVGKTPSGHVDLAAFRKALQKADRR